ncbi:nucleoside hydrolase [Salinarimonas chemoclinalis]|uniref:nucleoside hydrolase n=1 Tax=Salinarimonas chemoclinalis TaxID=3241599 RepID=UPI0035562BBD
MTRAIIIDTDPGQDDAIAILLALASPELEVLGVCAVAGNVPLALTSVNVRKVLELAGRTDVPAFAGADRPLLRPLVTAEYVHGKTGLDGADLPEPTMPLDSRHAVDFIVETVMSRPPRTVTLCPLAPLTNIALALAKEPRLAERLQGIVLMGGGVFEGGNRTPAAEFNVYVDPEAAQRVFASGADVTFIPLDCTHRALTTAKRTAAIRALGTPLSQAVAGWLDFFERFDEAKYGTDGGPLHDPCVIAWLLRPDLFRGKRVHVAVETGSELTRGMTVVDWWGVVDAAPNATMLREIDADGFFALLTERLARL